MKLGFAVKVLGGGGLPTHDARRWQSGPHLRWSVEALHGVFDYLERAGIGMYRMTAWLAPYATHPDLRQFAGQVADCEEELAGLGSRAAALGLRLSTHPGQYVVLNSEDEAIQTSAIRDLELQGELLEAMSVGPECVVTLHVGGGAGGHVAAMERFERGLERLSERARGRLTIENDDRTFALSHVLALHRRTGLKVVWDILHHHFVVIRWFGGGSGGCQGVAGGRGCPAAYRACVGGQRRPSGAFWRRRRGDLEMTNHDT